MAAERWRSPAAESGSEARADAGGSQRQALVRRAVEQLASIRLPLGAENPLGLWMRPVAGGVPALHRHLAEALGFQHHGKLVSVIPPQPMRPQLRLHQAPLFEDLMPHPDMLHLLDTVGHGGLVDEDGGAVGGGAPLNAV